jgi:alkyldihydroxyacetonephosphate synthase
MVEGLEVVLADGSVVRTGWRGPRAAMGPDLTQLFVGNEGTLGIITSARLRLHHLPESRWQGAWVFPDLSSGLAACRRVVQGGATPAVLRLYDRRESKRHFGEVADGCALVVLDEAPAAILAASRAVVEQACGLAERGSDTWVDHWLESRNDVSGLGKAVEAGLAVDTCEIAAPWSVIAGLADAAPAAVMSVEGSLAATVHASHHYSDGACLYITFAGKADDVDRWYRGVWDGLMASTLAAGGTISHHHGIGLVRGAYMAEALGPAFGVLTSLKAALDPVGILNPGKLGLPSPFGPSPWP